MHAFLLATARHHVFAQSFALLLIRADQIDSARIKRSANEEGSRTPVTPSGVIASRGISFQLVDVAQEYDRLEAYPTENSQPRRGMPTLVLASTVK